MQRRLFPQIVLTGLLACIFILSACGGSTTSTASTTTAPVKLSLANDKAGWAPWFNSVGQYMTGKYQIGFQSQPYSDTNVYQGVIRSAAMTSKAPPLFTWWSGSQIQDLAKTGAIADLTPQMQGWIKNQGVNPALAKSFEYNGHYYGAPSYLAYWVVFYNKHVFSQYNLQPPTTWQQFMQLNDTLKSHGVAPIAQYSQDAWTGFIWFENLLINSDPQLYENLMQGKASYKDPGVVKVMQLWKSMEDKGYFSTPLNAANPPKEFAQGKVAMDLMGQWFEPGLIQAGMKPGTDFGAFIMPTITPGLSPQIVFESSPIVVAAHSPSKDQAVKAVDTFMRPDVQQKWVEATNFVSADASVPANNDINVQVNKEVTSNNITLHNRYWEATPPQIAVPAASAFIQFVLHPDTYMQVLQNCDSLAQQYWSTHK